MLAILLFLSAVGQNAIAQLPPSSPTPPAIVGAFSLTASRFAADPIRARIYATIPASRSVAVINTNSLTLEKSIVVGPDPEGLCLSPDGSKLFVANSGAATVSVIDLNTLAQPTVLVIPEQPSDIEAGRDNRLYITPANSAVGGIMQVDATTGQSQGRVGSFASDGGLIEISPDRRTLYFGDRGLSPSTLRKYDVSTSTATLIQQSDLNQTGSSGRDLKLSHNGQFLCFPNTEGNDPSNPHTTAVIPAADLNAVLGSFANGPFPGPIAFTPDDSLAFQAVTGSDPRIGIYSTTSYLELAAIPILASSVADVIVDSSGRFLFVAEGSDVKGTIKVYKIGPKPLNISTRGFVGSGDNVLIGGFIISGESAMKVILRAIGPSLAARGVAGVLANPTIELRDSSGALLVFNDNWKESQEQEISDTGVAPSNNQESAIVRTLPPSAYTVIMRGANSTTGVGLVEIYDLEQSPVSRLANISTRGTVQGGDNVLIGGFILSSGLHSGRVLVRAIGPSLAAHGVSAPLADPTLEVYNAQGTSIAANDNWMSSQKTEIEKTGLAPSHASESAVLVLVAPATNYTAIVRGSNGSAGVGLIEVYNF